MISVIVPVRNGMPWLVEQLRALTEQECHLPWEVIVADNNSTDESRSVVEEWVNRSDRVRLVDASHVRGPGATRNVGVGEARGELLAFCDADDVAQPGWLTAHVLALADADISAGVFDAWSLNGLGAPSSSSYAPPPAMGLYGFLPAAGSGNVAFRRRVFEELGGFTEDMMTGEDIDLSWRGAARGASLRVVHGCRGCQTRSAGFQGGIQTLHRLRTVRSGPLPSIPYRRPPA